MVRSSQLAKSIKKENLPKKICPVCKLEFTWRKKWELDWDNVIYCSNRCKKLK
jgi:hypothetical protein